MKARIDLLELPEECAASGPPRSGARTRSRPARRSAGFASAAGPRSRGPFPSLLERSRDAAPPRDRGDQPRRLRRHGDPQREQEHGAADRDLGRPRRETGCEVHQQPVDSIGDPEARPPPINASTTLSVKSCRVSRPRPLRVPSAGRSPSRGGSAARASGSRRSRRRSAEPVPPLRAARGTSVARRVSSSVSGTGASFRPIDAG